jgi:hypothetical protein
LLPPNAPPALPAAAGPLTTAHDTAIIDIGSRHLNILVFDLGGGTFDVTLLTIDQGVYEVLATSGDTNLGGEDFDQRIMAHFTKQITKERRVDISKDARALQKLRKEAERARRELSSEELRHAGGRRHPQRRRLPGRVHARQGRAAVRRPPQEGGGIAWRQHVAAACDRRRGEGKGGRPFLPHGEERSW